MGYALAEAFIRLGAEVTLVSGPVQLSEPDGVHDVVKVQTAQEMFDAAVQRFPSTDIAVAAAAVADARPAARASTRINEHGALASFAGFIEGGGTDFWLRPCPLL